MILDFSSRPAEAHLYDVLDAETGEVIDEPIWYANDDRGFYSRYVTRRDGGPPGPLVFEGDPVTGEPLWVDVVRPIRIVPRLERLCASLRASLAEQGVSADEIPEPVLGALALFQERLERRITEAMAHPQVRVESVTTAERMGNPDGRYPVCMPRIGEAVHCVRCGGRIRPGVTVPCPAVPREQRWGPSVEARTTPAVNSAEWLEAVTRTGLPWTRADLERLLPEVRLEAVTTPAAPGAAREYLAGVSATAQGVPTVPHDSDLD